MWPDGILECVCWLGGTVLCDRMLSNDLRCAGRNVGQMMSSLVQRRKRWRAHVGPPTEEGTVLQIGRRQAKCG